MLHLHFHLWTHRLIIIIFKIAKKIPIPYSVRLHWLPFRIIPFKCFIIERLNFLAATYVEWNERVGCEWEAQQKIVICHLKIRNWNHLSNRIQMCRKKEKIHKLWRMFCSLFFNLTNFIFVFRFLRWTLFIMSIKDIYFVLVPLAREFFPLHCRNDYMYYYASLLYFTSQNTLSLQSRFTMSTFSFHSIVCCIPLSILSIRNF